MAKSDDKNSSTDDKNKSDKDDKNTPATGEQKPDDIDAMKSALRKANKEAEQSRLKLKELEDRDKSDSEKLTDKIAAAEKRSDDSENRAMRLEVALDKGLTAGQSKRLVGSTVEELTADADELLSSFTSADGDKTKPATRQPSQKLTPGGDAEEDPEPDIDKVLAKVPRL